MSDDMISHRYEIVGNDARWWTVLDYVTVNAGGTSSEQCLGGDKHWAERRWAEQAKRVYEEAYMGWDFHGMPLEIIRKVYLDLTREEF
jgi:hypothetical protein